MAMASPQLSIVIPIRDRASQRLDNCLTSLRWQDFPRGQTEIILSDFGSQPPALREIEAVAGRHRVRVVHTPTSQLWNRSRALNIGIQAATGERVLCTDCDMIFAPNFLTTATQALDRNAGNALVLCRCRDLPAELPEQPWRLGDFPALLARASFRVARGTGACQCSQRRWFVKVRGYDEKYVFWGFEDKDMVARARRSGLTLCWIHEQTQMLHQWHPPTRHQRLLRKHMNKLRYKLTGWIVRKNRTGWGLEE
jgi:glycosyltransferase involved in cell wall biosynthesis